MSGTLYLVGTPIGNLGDLSVRALETLRSADFIAAEDTRVTAKLLNHFEIKKPCVSYYEHNKYASGEKIVARLLAGETCALVTDAGMPAISDPGEDIVRQCAEQGIDVQVIPGPCAAIAALAVSGLPTQQFCFEGFLAVSGKTRREHLERLRGETRTMIFYEAPHKLLRTLCDLRDTFGGAREITLARELTKLHEQKLRTTLDGAVAYFTETPPKGEFVLVLRGAPERSEPVVTAEQALEIVARYRSNKHDKQSFFRRHSLHSLTLPAPPSETHPGSLFGIRLSKNSDKIADSSFFLCKDTKNSYFCAGVSLIRPAPTDSPR